MVATVGGVLGGIAYASIPDSGGVINACYSKKGGALRVIDTGTGETCNTRTEIAVGWNQAGTPGPPGPAGTARAWASIGPAGVITSGLNVTSVDHLSTGLYCVFLNGINPSLAAPIATVYGGLKAVGVSPAGCGSPQGGIQVAIWYTDSGTPVDSGFAIAIP